MRFYNRSSKDMEEIKDESVQLIVTSPPYPMIKKWDDLFKTDNFGIQHYYLNETWKECNRVLSDGGMLCVNIGDATRKGDDGFQCWPNFAVLTYYLYIFGLVPLIPIFWKKISNRPNAFLGSGMLPTNGYVSQDHEYIAIFRKGNIRKLILIDMTPLLPKMSVIYGLDRYGISKEQEEQKRQVHSLKKYLTD